ncbi:MAG: sugar phosphate nucleotidyltransferase [Anaerolineales bacterium]|nr:sugar phosphate nucleotidyltransferase [Anaerolineales bacterium]
MRIVIPMAGYGTRLRPHTWSKPKPLVSVAGKAVLGHVLDMFADLPDVEEVVFIVGYLGRQVETYVAEHYPRLQARYLEQTEMLGQSHAVWLAREYLHGPILTIYVDTLIDTDFSSLQPDRPEAVAWVKAVPDPRRFGVAEVRPDGSVRRLVEKPEDASNNLVVVGGYFFPQGEALLSAIEKQMASGQRLQGEFFLADAINILLDEGLKMRTAPVDVWLDCGNADSLLETNRHLLATGSDNSAQAATRQGVVIVPPVYVDPSAVVQESVIGPHVSIGAECEIVRSVIQDSIVDAGSQIQGASLAGSLIGREARVIGRQQSLNVGDSSEIGFA